MRSQGSRSAFREAVTSASFSLTLGRGQIQVLSAIGHQTRNLSPVLYPQWCVSLQALHRRGLVEAADMLGQFYDSPYVETYKLTEAGRHVFRLCQIAGLVPEKVPVADREMKNA